MSSSVTSRCVTARSTRRMGRRRQPDAGGLQARERFGPVEARGARSICTKFVSTCSRSTGRPARVERLGERARAGVVLGEPLDVVIERVEPGRRHDPRLTHRAAEEVLLAPRAIHQLA